jgi:hypothetical protein
MAPPTPLLTATIAGLSYDLNDGEEIRLLAYDLGLAAVRRLAQRAPAQNGDTDLGYRTDARYLDLFFAIHGATVNEYRDIRERFMTIFQPRDDDPVQLIFDFGDRVRAVDVNLAGELVWKDRIERTEKVSGVFKASDWRLYDPEIRTVLFSLSAGGLPATGWPIPWPIPWAIGTDVLDMTVDIDYAGLSRLGAPEYPRFRILGPITDPMLTNETTGEVIDLSDNGGIVLADPTEWIDIDLTDKTMLDQDGNSVDQYLTVASDLATWHLAAAGERLPSGAYCTGTNTIRVTGSGINSDTVVVMSYFDRYSGV